MIKDTIIKIEAAFVNDVVGAVAVVVIVAA